MPSQPPESSPSLASVIGVLPYRMTLAGGWIDQPFLSGLNPSNPGAMVVVSLEPVLPFMNRSGLATSPRRVARQAWGEHLPEGDPAGLVRQLYRLENRTS